jgi:cytosol aminopeptidase family protein
MDLHFVLPDLQKLDEPMAAEVVACCIWKDELPMRGLAGLVDWRMSGRLSALERDGFLLGNAGEVLCVPGRPRIPFDKVLVFGLGARSGFDEELFKSAVRHVTKVLEGLKVRRAVVELPGRSDERISAELAAELLFECTSDSVSQDAWWIVERADGEKKMTDRTREAERRARRG